jgi:hypothetical protein
MRENILRKLLDEGVPTLTRPNIIWTLVCVISAWVSI